MQERKMTKSEKSKEKRLKDKYDDSGMKASMKKQYGKDWETVYYATIRKKAMGKKKTEGYTILPPIDRDRYQTRKGLEGPFQTKSGKPVYYDPKEGAYYDPDTDMYLTYDEWKALDEANRPPQPQPPKTTPVTPTPATPEPQYTDAIARAAQQAGQYDDTYVPPTPEPDLPPPGDPAIKPNVDDILRDLDRQYGTGDEFMPRDEDDIGNPRPPRDPSSFGPGGQPIPDPTPDPAPYSELPDPMDDLLGPDDGDITPPDPKPAQDPNPAGDDGATDMEGEGKPGPDDFEQERYLDDKGTTSNVGVKGARGKKEFAIATVGGKETKVYGSREALRAKYPDAPIFNADGTNESITMDARKRLNRIFEKALSEFEFNPRAGHMDQPSHPQNRGLTKQTSGAPKTSIRPKLRPKDVEMRAAIDAALRQAMGEGKLSEDEYNWWDRFLGRDKARNNPFRDSSGKPLSLGARAWPEPGEYEDPQGFRAGKYADYDMSELPTTRTIHGDTIASNRGDSTVSNATGRNSTVSNADGDYYYSDVPGYEKRPKNKAAYRDPNTGQWKTESVNEWGGDDQYQAVEGFIENALSIFDEMLDNGVDELRARAEAHDYLKGELSDLGVTHGDMESKQYHSELEKEIVQIMNRRDKGMREGHSPHKKGTAKYKAHMAAMHAGMNEGKYGKKKKKKKYNEDDTDSGYGWRDAAIAAGGLGTAYAAGKIANRTPKPLTPYQQLKKDQKVARQAQKQLDRQNRKLAKNNMSVAQSNDKIAQLKQKYPNLGNQNIKAVPDTKLQKAAKFGKAAGKFALKKIAWPIALGYAANSAYKGYHSDPNASLAKKVKNAGVQAVDDYTGGAVGYVYDKMFGEATKSLQEQGFTVQDLQEKVDQFILVKENVDTLRKIVADKSVMPVKFEDGTMKVDMTTASIFLQAFDKMREDNQAKVAEMMRTKKGFLRVMDIIYGAMK